MLIQKDDKPVTDVESNAPTESAKASYSPQDARSGLLKKPSPQSDVPSYPETGDVKLEMPKRQQKSPTKKNKGKGRRESAVKNTDAADENTKAAGKLNSDGPAVTKEEETGTESTKTITEPTKPATVDGPTSSAEEHKFSPFESTPALDQPENVADASTVLPPKDPETLEAGQDAKTTQKERDTDVPLNFAGALAKNLETTSDATPIAKDSENTVGGPSSSTPIESSAHLADNDVSDDEAKNDTSFHSAPEILRIHSHGRNDGCGYWHHDEAFQTKPQQICRQEWRSEPFHASLGGLCKPRSQHVHPGNARERRHRKHRVQKDVSCLLRNLRGRIDFPPPSCYDACH
jgi:hypothetical protein